MSTMEISAEPTHFQNKETLEEKLKHHESEMKSNEKEKQFAQNHKDGMETVAKLLKEVRRDLVDAEKKNKWFEIAIKNLQNRLMQNGLNSDCTIDGEDIFIPGPSKQIMDNLMRENVRLKSMSRDPEEMQPLKQTLQEYENDIRLLQQEVEELRQKPSLRTRSPLGSKQEGLIREQQMKIEKMQEEIYKLEQERVTRSSSPQTQLPRILQGIHVDFTEFDKLKSENKEYAARISQLEEMNKRWKLYNDQQESKIQRLHSHVQTTFTQESMQKLLQESKQQLLSTLTEKQLFQEQVSHLDDELKTLQEAFSAQGEELRLTTEELTEIRINGTSDDNERNALKAQVQICTEDFESERKDRETAQSKLSQVEQENQTLRREINRLQQQILSTSPPPRPQFQSMNIPPRPQPPNNPYRGQVQFHQEPERMNARGGRKFSPPNDLFTTEAIDGGWDMVDSVAQGKGRGTLKNRGDSPATKEGYPLRCLKCGKEYGPGQDNELEEHTDICR